MRKSMKLLTVTGALVAVLSIAPALHAHDTKGSQDSMMGQGGMMQGGQGGMMKMMGQMSQMMESCNKMMQSMTHEHGPKKPDEQRQKKGPEKPENKG